MAFSPSGDNLIATSIDDDHYIAGWNIKGKSPALLFNTKGGREVIRDLDFKNEN